MNPRAGLFWIWAAGYMMCLSVLFVFILRRDAPPSSFPDYLASLTSTYAPYLGAIIAFWISEEHQGSQTIVNSGHPFWIAVVCSVIFNVVVLFLLVDVEFQSEGRGILEATLRAISKSAAVLSVFTAPSVGYFFGKVRSGSEVRPSAKPGKKPS